MIPGQPFCAAPILETVFEAVADSVIITEFAPEGGIAVDGAGQRIGEMRLEARAHSPKGVFFLAEIDAVDDERSASQ